MSKKILITNLSVLNNNPMKNSYSSENDEEIIEGVMTNEAPTKMVLKQNGEIDKIIAITSTDVINPPTILSGIFEWLKENIGMDKMRVWKHFFESGDTDSLSEKNLTHYDYYRNTIEDYCRELNIVMPEFITVKLDNEPDYNDTLEVAMSVKSIISDMAQNSDDSIELYVEANGGIRYVLTMLISVINTLEKNESRIKLKAVYNTAYKNDKKYKYIITNQKKVYDSIEILSAIDEFIYYGKTKSLKRLLYGVVEGQKIEDKRVEVIIGKLEKTADDLQLCRTDSVFEDFYGTNDERGVIDTLEEYLADDENNNDPVDILFRHIAGIIDNEYSALKKYRCENDGKKLLGIIKWCISKEYIQQAVTFCSERIPKALHEMGIFMIKPRFMEYIEGIRGDKNVYELFYDIIANFTGKNPYGQQILKAASYNTIDRILSQNVSIHPRKADYLNSLKNNIEIPAGNIVCRKENQMIQDLIEVSNCISKKKKLPKDSNSELATYDGKYLYNKKSKLRLSVNDLIAEQPITNEDDNKTYIRKIEAILNECPNIYFSVNSSLKALDFSPLVDSLFEDDGHRSVFLKWITESILVHDISVYADGVNFISNKNNFNKIVCTYRILKEQRNMLNHANVSQDAVAVCLNSSQLIQVMEYLISEIEAD